MSQPRDHPRVLWLMKHEPATVVYRCPVTDTLRVVTLSAKAMAALYEMSDEVDKSPVDLVDDDVPAPTPYLRLAD